MEELKWRRGDVVICALRGAYGKPRPAVVVQSNLFNPTHASVTLCPLTSHLIEAPLFRLPIAVTSETGLKADSQIMVDKIVTIGQDKISNRIGRLSIAQLRRLDESLKLWLGLQETFSGG